MKSTTKTTLGVVGYGVMGAAIGRCYARSDELQERFTLNILARKPPENERGDRPFNFASSLEELAVKSDIIIIAVRTEQVKQAVLDIGQYLPADTPDKSRLVISLATGVPISVIDEAGQGKLAVARVMPNVLLEVNRGIFGLCAEKNLSDAHKEMIHFLFDRLGTVIELDEAQMNNFTGLAGCGPGFLFYIMDAFIEAGVSIGLTREASRSIAIGLMGGCAELASSTGRHPAILREQGISPAGMTITGINHLDRCGVRGHIIDGVKTAYEHGKVMDQDTVSGT
ncbi:pyrroline-5-carboxylate reductase [Deltaproteobacteria bacterium Smac51]|nr:pyrroline-5-carboxylate reductase [Deltaproteobacteria bacterium Smac51]